MVIDKDGTKAVPGDWEIWTTGNKWQAVTKRATESDTSSYGLIRKTRDESVQDAIRLDKTTKVKE